MNTKIKISVILSALLVSTNLHAEKAKFLLLNNNILGKVNGRTESTSNFEKNTIGNISSVYQVADYFYSRRDEQDNYNTFVNKYFKDDVARKNLQTEIKKDDVLINKIIDAIENRDKLITTGIGLYLKNALTQAGEVTEEINKFNISSKYNSLDDTKKQLVRNKFLELALVGQLNEKLFLDSQFKETESYNVKPDSNNDTYYDSYKVMRLNGGDNLEIDYAGSNAKIQATHEDKIDDTYTYRYLTVDGEEKSSITYNLTNENLSFEILGNKEGTPAIIGKNSNLTINIPNNTQKIRVGGTNIGFGDEIFQDLATISGTNSNSSFKLTNKGDINVAEIDSIYMNKGSKYELISTDGDIVFEGQTRNQLTTSLDASYYPILKEPKPNNPRYIPVGNGTEFKLKANNISNVGFILASGESGKVDITGNFTNTGNGINLNGTEIISRDTGDDKDKIITKGTVIAKDGGSVNITGDTTNNGSLVNLGGKFKVTGNLNSQNGSLIAGQSKADGDVGFFEVTGTTTLGENSKIALALHENSQPLKGATAYKFIQSEGGITGADSIKQENIYLLTINKEQNSQKLDELEIKNTITANDKEAQKTANKYLKVELKSPDNKELYYKLSLTEEALNTPIDQIVKPSSPSSPNSPNIPDITPPSNNKTGLSDNKVKQIVNKIESIKGLTQKYGVTLFNEYEKAINGDTKAAENLTKSLDNLDKSTASFNTTAKNQNIQNIINLTTNVNTQNRLSKLSDPSANYFATRALINELNGEEYARSLIIMSDVEDELVTKMREEKTKISNSDNKNSFWFNAIGSKGSLKDSDAKFKLAGFSAGVDRQGDDYLFGVYSMLAKSKSNVGEYIQSDTKHIQAGAYARFFNQNYELDVSGFYGVGINKTTRNVEFFNDNLQYKSDSINSTFGLSSSIGYGFNVGDSIILKPAFGGNLYISKLPQIEESGNELKLKSSGGYDTAFSLLTNLELRYYIFGTGYLYLVPSIETEVYKNSTNHVKYAGSDVIAQNTSNSKKTYFNITGGTELKVTQNSSFNLGLGTKIANDEKYHNINAGFKVRF